mgnify:CR=1 FL=1
MIIGMLAFLLAAVLILLLIPIRYTVTLVRWRLTLSVSVLLGLWRKEIELPPAREEPSPQVEMAEEPPMEMTEEPPMDWMEEALSQAEEKAEVHERLPDAAEAQVEREEKKGASLWREIRFAMGNGLAERVLHAAGRLLSHSFPRRCRIRGDFGTGDPMTTGIACGMAMAFLAQETKEIRWNYLQPVNTLSGEAKGRIIPLTMIYIAGRLLLSRPAREFWHFRKEEKNHG